MNKHSDNIQPYWDVPTHEILAVNPVFNVLIPKFDTIFALHFIMFHFGDIYTLI